jgi:hypothetical protein
MRNGHPVARTGNVHATRFVRLGILTLAVAGALAACSTPAAPSNGVATLDSPSPDASSSADTSAGASLSPDDVYQQMLAYSQCMRSHGVPTFPDPVNNGGQIGLMLQGGPGTGLDPNSTTFKAADEACHSLMPAPKTGTDGQVPEKAREQALQFSQCMRSHGVPDFPDPQFSNGGISIGGGEQKGTSLDPNSATFQAAQKACESLMPGFGGGGTTTQSNGSPTSSSQP